MEETKGGIILATAKDIAPKVVPADAMEVDAQKAHLLLAEGRRQAIEWVVGELAKIQALAEAKAKPGKHMPKHQRIANLRHAFRGLKRFGSFLLESIKDAPKLKLAPKQAMPAMRMEGPKK